MEGLRGPTEEKGIGKQMSLAIWLGTGRVSVQYLSLWLTSSFRCTHSTFRKQPQGGPPTIPKACTTTAGTASHPPRSVWRTAWHQACSRSQPGVRVQSQPSWSHARACFFRAARTSSALTALSLFLATLMTKKKILQGKVSLHGDLMEHTCGCESVGSITPSLLCTEDTPRAQQVLLPAPVSSSVATLAVPS